MAETSYKDYKLRQLILNEWRAKSELDDATTNICAKLGENAVTSTKVNYWYKRFNKGDTAMFIKKSKLYVSTQVKGQDASNSLLLLTNKRAFNGEMVTNDGRFAVFVRDNGFVVVSDLFHGSQKEISLPDYFDRMIFMVGEHLINGAYTNKIHALKIDDEDLTVSTLKSVSVHGGDHFCRDIISDQLNNNRFLIIASGYALNALEKFAIGQVIDGNIVLGEFNDFSSNNMIYKRFLGNKLQGFIHGQSTELKFCKLDLDTMQATTKAAPIVLNNDGSFEVPLDCHFEYHSWAGDCFYGFLEDDLDNQFHLLAFNSKTNSWANVRISATNPKHLFASPDGTLTLNVSDEKFNLFYRFATKKPDSLKNLAWFTILRNSVVLGSEIYSRIAHLLPYNCGLRSMIPSNGKK